MNVKIGQFLSGAAHNSYYFLIKIFDFNQEGIA